MDKLAAYDLALADHPLWAEKAASGASGHHPAGYEERVLKRHGTSLSAFRKRWKAGKKVPTDVAEALDIEAQSARTQRSVPASRAGLSPYDHVIYDSKKEMVELIANTPPGGKKKVPWFAPHLSPAGLKRVRRYSDKEHGTDFSITMRPSVARQNPKLRPLVDGAVKEQLERLRGRAMGPPSPDHLGLRQGDLVKR